MFAILAVLIPMAIYANLRAFRGARPTGPRIIPPPRTSIVPVPPLAPVAEEEARERTTEREAVPFNLTVPVNAARFKRLVASGKWGRNPFLTTEEILKSRRGVIKGPKAVIAKERPAYVPELTVSSVLISDEERVAVINGEFYAVGNLIPATGERVTAITPEGVLLEGERGQRQVSLEQSKIPLKSRDR